MSNVNRTYVFESSSGFTADGNDYVTGSTFNPSTGELESTRLSGGTFSVGLDGRYALSGDTSTNTDNYLTGTTFNTTDGILTLNMLSGDTIIQDLDGRYLLSDDYTPGDSDTNDYVTSGSFNTTTGDVTLTRLSGGTVVYNLDNRYSLTGHTHVSDNTDDYVTGATFNTANGILELTRLSGSTVQVDLDDRYSLTGHTHIIDDITDFTDNSTNWDEAYDDSITGMTITGTTIKTITLEQRDGGTITADYIDDAGGGGGSGDAVTGMTFNTSTGELSLETVSGNTITEDLDGRYFISGPVTFDIDTSGTTTYVGYGEVNACKIRKVDTISGSTYTAFWSNGEEDLDKIWNNRLTYSYF